MPRHYFQCGIVIGVVCMIGMFRLNVSLLAQLLGTVNFAYSYMAFIYNIMLFAVESSAG